MSKYSDYADYAKQFREKIRETSYDRRLVISGEHIEEYTYEKRISVGKKSKRLRKKKKTKQTEMRSGALRRSQMNIMRLVNSNIDFVTFVTLTFNETIFENKKDITELEKCNAIFMKFIQRIRYIFPNIKYLSIPEFQGDYYFKTNIKKEFGGALHYHLLFNQTIDNTLLQQQWPHGFVKINKIKSINNVGLYVSRYLSKESFNEKYFGKKKYFCSRNLDRPQIFNGDDCKVVDMTYLPMHDLVYEKEFYNDYRGVVKLKLHKLNLKKK